MGHWKKPFKSDHLASCDIEGKDVVLVIREVKQEVCRLPNGEELCNVAYFTDSSFKPMILNVGNSKIVKGFSGGNPDTDFWKNIPVTIYVDPKVRFGKETVEGLRIRPFQPRISSTGAPTKITLTPTSGNWKDIVKWVQDGGDINSVWKKYEVGEADKKTFMEEAEVKNAE